MALVWPQKPAVSPDIIRWRWNKTFFLTLFLLLDIVLCCSIETGLFFSKENKFKGAVRQCERSLDLRMRAGLVFRLDHRYCVTVLLQVPWGHWRPHSEFCSPKSKWGHLDYSAPCRPCGQKKTSWFCSSPPTFFP